MSLFLRKVEIMNFLETENEKLKNQLKEQQDKNKSLLEDINKKTVEVPKTFDNSRRVL